MLYNSASRNSIPHPAHHSRRTSLPSTRALSHSTWKPSDAEKKPVDLYQSIQYNPGTLSPNESTPVLYVTIIGKNSKVHSVPLYSTSSPSEVLKEELKNSGMSPEQLDALIQTTASNFKGITDVLQSSGPVVPQPKNNTPSHLGASSRMSQGSFGLYSTLKSIKNSPVMVASSIPKSSSPTTIRKSMSPSSKRSRVVINPKFMEELKGNQKEGEIQWKDLGILDTEEANKELKVIKRNFSMDRLKWERVRKEKKM